MSDTKAPKAREYPPDPRGGLFIDNGDGTRTHESELTGAQRERLGLPILAPQPEPEEPEEVIDDA